MAFRDDQDALHARLDALEMQLDEERSQRVNLEEQLENERSLRNELEQKHALQLRENTALTKATGTAVSYNPDDTTPPSITRLTKQGRAIQARRGKWQTPMTKLEERELRQRAGATLLPASFHLLSFIQWSIRFAITPSILWALYAEEMAIVGSVLCGVPLLEGVTWVLRHRRRKAVLQQELAWIRDLPFPLVSYLPWLAGRFGRFMITWQGELPTNTVASALQAIDPGARLRCLEKTIVVTLSSSAADPRRRVDCLHRMVREVLLPIQETFPIANIEFILE